MIEFKSIEQAYNARHLASQSINAKAFIDGYEGVDRSCLYSAEDGSRKVYDDYWLKGSYKADEDWRQVRGIT